METRRWVNKSQPDTMQIAVWLLYFRAVITLLFGLDAQYIVFPADDLFRVAMPFAMAGGAFGIANERRWGYRLAVVVAALPLVARLLVGFGISLSSVDINATSPLDYDLFGLLFEVALVALLVHPRSREYEKIWFK